jgi:hypothetical protein
VIRPNAISRRQTGLTGEKTMIRDSRMARRLAMGASALTALVMLEGCPSTSLYNSREMIGFPITAAQMSVPDGLAHDAGWGNSFRMFLEDGSVQSASFMRGVANQDHVYLYVEAEDTVFENTDALIVAFNPTNANDKFMRLHIYPCRLNGGGTCPGTGDVSTSNLPAEVEFETGTLNAGTGGGCRPFGDGAGRECQSLVSRNPARSRDLPVPHHRHLRHVRRCDRHQSRHAGYSCLRRPI